MCLCVWDVGKQSNCSFQLNTLSWTAEVAGESASRPDAVDAFPLAKDSGAMYKGERLAYAPQPSSS